MARGTKTPLDKLESAIAKMLTEYGEEITENVRTLVPKVAKTGASALRDTSRNSFGGSGAYARGWTSAAENGRMYTTATIYNKKPGLPHLLEHGHAKRGGGRVPGTVHIAPIEQEIAENFEKELEATL